MCRVPARLPLKQTVAASRQFRTLCKKHRSGLDLIEGFFVRVGRSIHRSASFNPGSVHLVSVAGLRHLMFAVDTWRSATEQEINLPGEIEPE
jgi:hypothetical protein